MISAKPVIALLTLDIWTSAMNCFCVTNRTWLPSKANMSTRQVTDLLLLVPIQLICRRSLPIGEVGLVRPCNGKDATIHVKIYAFCHAPVYATIRGYIGGLKRYRNRVEWYYCSVGPIEKVSVIRCLHFPKNPNKSSENNPRREYRFPKRTL